MIHIHCVHRLKAWNQMILENKFGRNVTGCVTFSASWLGHKVTLFKTLEFSSYEILKNFAVANQN